MIMKNGVPNHIFTRMVANRAQNGSLNQGLGLILNWTRIQFRALWVGSKIHHHPRVLSESGITQEIRAIPRQMRCPRSGSALMDRARMKPNVAFRKTAVSVKVTELRTTSQNVS